MDSVASVGTLMLAVLYVFVCLGGVAVGLLLSWAVYAGIVVMRRRCGERRERATENAYMERRERLLRDLADGLDIPNELRTSTSRRWWS